MSLNPKFQTFMANSNKKGTDFENKGEYSKVDFGLNYVPKIERQIGQIPHITHLFEKRVPLVLVNNGF